MPEEYPTKWYYHEENKWITRETSKEDGEIWCEFNEPPEEDEIEWILEVMNALEEEPAAVLVPPSIECKKCRSVLSSEIYSILKDEEGGKP